MNSITLPYPEWLEAAVHLTPEELGAQIRLMAALKMFELGKLSSGQAAELAGLSRVDFFEMCGRYRVPIIRDDSVDLEAELRADAETARLARA